MSLLAVPDTRRDVGFCFNGRLVDRAFSGDLTVLAQRMNLDARIIAGFCGLEGAINKVGPGHTCYTVSDRRVMDPQIYSSG